jgi:sarcosine oxidase delta subunit
MTTTAQTAKTVLNFDNYGSFWGMESVEVTEYLITKERANGAAIDEWHETDRDGRPLRIVRIADPDFLDTICVIPLGVGECPYCGAPLSSTAASLDEHHLKCPLHDPRF